MIHRKALVHSFISCLLITAQSQTVTREEIIASRDLRYRQLEGVLDRAMKQIENHRSGVKPLPQKKVDQLESKIQIYEHQIEELGRALDEEEIERMIKIREDYLKSREHGEL